MLLIVEMRQANRTKIFVETFPIESIKNAFSVAMATLLGKQQQMQFVRVRAMYVLFTGND